ncbi:MAG: hypothetical protein V1933_03755 [Candidatus Omnitrophota bacterium]
MSKKVYILGSGFSAAFGFPTTSGIIEIIQSGKYVPNNYLAIFQKTQKSIIEVLCPNNKGKKFNLADYLTFVDLLIELGYGRREHLEEYRRYFLRALRKYFMGKATKIKPQYVKILRKWLRSFSPNDSIISFNWDTLIERIVQSDDYGPIEEFKIGQLVKPHGSIDWLDTIINESSHYIDTTYKDKSSSIYRLSSNKWENEYEKIEASPLVVLPSFRQNYKYYAGLFLIAQGIIKKASSITIIGLSLREEDFSIRLILRLAIWDQARNKVREDLNIINVVDKHMFCDKLNERYLHHICADEGKINFCERDAMEWLKDVER